MSKALWCLLCCRLLESGELTTHVEEHGKEAIRPPLFMVDIPDKDTDD